MGDPNDDAGATRLADASSDAGGHGTAPGRRTLSAGRSHDCAITSTGAVRCFGDDTYGQLGNGSDTGYTRSFVAVSGVSSAVELASGTHHTCALTSSGTVACWGDNSFGQLGRGENAGNIGWSAAEVVGLPSGAIAISAYRHGMVAFYPDGTAWGWGDSILWSRNAQTSKVEKSPVKLAGWGALKRVAFGAHICTLDLSNDVKCKDWQLGVLNVTGVGSTSSLSTGYEHTCATTTSGAVTCWGVDTYGQLGAGASCPCSTTASYAAVAVSTSAAAVDVAASAYTTCALLVNGKVQCWGANDKGGLGVGQPDGTRTGIPKDVIGVTGGTAIVAAAEHTCVRTASGVACWGNFSPPDSVAWGSGTPFYVDGF